jgi:prefoldin subunit 5
MNARQELAGIMEQWLQLTQDEGAAIQRSQWQALKRIQARKSALRSSFTEAVQKCAEASGTRHPVLKPFQARAAKIMALLNRNAAALSAQLSRARARQEKLNQTRGNLQKIQRSYASTQPRRSWQSYS